jgi:hypothetical protein
MRAGARRDSSAGSIAINRRKEAVMKYNELKYLTAHNAFAASDYGSIWKIALRSQGGHGLVDLKYWS